MNSDNWRVKREPGSEKPTFGNKSPLQHRVQRSPFGKRESSADEKSAFAPRSPFGQRNFNTRDCPEQSTPVRFPGTARDGHRKPLKDTQADKSIEEGRRLYVGNLPYEASVQDVEKLFQDVAAGIESINMAVDPMTGRNPSYCFVDFESKELAERVMQEYDGRDFLQRILKVRRGIKSSYQNSQRGRIETRSNNHQYTPGDRWNRLEKPEDHQAALDEGRRLYVGGLPRFKNQVYTNEQIRSLFTGFDVDVVSKLVSAHESLKEKPGNHNYCFVDLTSAKDTDRAIRELNGKEIWGSRIKVNHSSGQSRKLGERHRLFVGGLPEFPDQEATEAGINELFKGYEVSRVTKLFFPRDSSEEPEREGRRCYCFVELADESQTDKAILELDWKEMWDGKVRVKPATSKEQRANKTGLGDWRAENRKNTSEGDSIEDLGGGFAEVSINEDDK